MKIIPPHQITSDILNLIDNSKNYLVLVSPYVNFKNWDSIKVYILNAIKRGVQIEFYTRLDNDNFKSWETIEQLGIKPKLIKNLHAKLYFNETTGIVTSMNLLTSSNNNALEFGSVYDKEEELIELRQFVKKHLETNLENTKPSEEDRYFAKERFSIILSHALSNKFNRTVKTRWRNGSIEFNVNNQYYFEVDKGSNIVYITGIVSGLESENFNDFKQSLNINRFEAFVTTSTIYIASTFKLSNSNLNFISIAEKKRLIEATVLFVEQLTNFKRACYEKSKI